MTDESGTAQPEAPVAGENRHRGPGADQSGGQQAEAGQSESSNPYWSSGWRIYYRPGDWLVLSGPTSVVMLQPAALPPTNMIAPLWQQVVAAASIDELAASLAAFPRSEVPDLAVLFWGADGMRSLVRGQVSILDPRSDVPVANGEGIQTWSEMGLGSLAAVRVTTDTQQASGPTDDPGLPLVVGAVRASEVLLDASAEMRLVSPQGTHAGVPEPLAAEIGEPNPSGESHREESNMGGSEVSASAPLAAGAAGGQPIPEADSPANPGHSVSKPPAQPVAAVLHLSSGTQPEVEVDRPVLIGRAPVMAGAAGEELPRLITVPRLNKGISRTHIQVTPNGEQVTVRDMNSTNGTILICPDGSREQLPPGQDIVAARGSVLDLGSDMTIAIDQPDSDQPDS